MRKIICIAVLLLAGCTQNSSAPLPPGAQLSERFRVENTAGKTPAVVLSTPITGEMAFDFTTVDGGKTKVRYYLKPPVDNAYRDMTYYGPDVPEGVRTDGVIEYGTQLWYVRFNSAMYGPHENIEGQPVISSDGDHVAFVGRSAKTFPEYYLVIDGLRSGNYREIRGLTATTEGSYKAEACRYDDKANYVCFILNNFDEAPL